MSFDLYVWPIDRQVTQEEAASELERLSDYDRPREATDPRLRAFVAELRARFPEGFPDKSEIDADWQPPEGTVVFELNESREHAFLGIPWSFVSPVGAAAQEIAFRHDLMLFDPQSEMAILPPTFGGEPIDWTAPDDSEVEAMANDFSARWRSICRTSTWTTTKMRCGRSCARSRPAAGGWRCRWDSG